MAIKSTIELEVKSNLKGFKGEIRQATIEAQEAVRTFGEFSPQAIEAEKRLAQLRDRMDDFNDRVSAVNPDKFAQVQTIVQGVSRGFQAAQGAMALFGSESEDLQKTMVKLQGAMALADGLEGLGKIQQQFTAIFNGVISGAKKAFNAIRAGISSTGIGLVVVALGTIVAYWDDIKEAVSGVDEGQKELLKNTMKTAEANEKSYDNISKSENILKAQGKTEEEILKIKINSAKVAIQNLRAQLTTQENLRQSQIDSATRNRDILQGMIRWVMAPLSILLKGIDMVGDALGKKLNLEEGFSKGIAEMLFDPEEVKQESDKAIQESKDALLKLENDVAGYELSLNDIHANGIKDRQKLNEDELAKQKQHLKDVQSLNQELQVLQADNADKEQVQLAQWYENALKEYANNQEALLVLENIYNYKRQELREKDLKNAEKVIAKQVEEVKFGEQTKTYLQQQTYRKQYTEAEKYQLLMKAHYDKLIDFAKGFFEVSAELAETFARKDEESQRRAFNFAKALKIASTIMSTIEGVQNAYKTAQDSPITAVVPAYPYIQAGLAGAFGVAQVAKLKATKFNTQQASQQSGGGIPQMSAPQTSSSLLQQGGNEQLTQQQRVYVLEGDITRTQQRVSNNKKVSIVK